MTMEPEYLLRGRKIKKIVEQSCYAFRKQYGLKQADVDVLAYLSGHPGTSACQIAGDLDLHKGQLSEALAHLVSLRLVSEHHDAMDHRYMHYEVTDAGRPLIENVRKAKKRVREQMFRGFTNEEIAELQRLMQKVAVNINEAVHQMN